MRRLGVQGECARIYQEFELLILGRSIAMFSRCICWRCCLAQHSIVSVP